MYIRSLALVSLCILYSCQGLSQSFEGKWSGELQTPQINLPLILELIKEENWSGTLLSPKQSSTKIPLSKVGVHGDSLFIEVSQLKLSFSGKLSSDGDTIKGIFQQGMLQVPMILARGSQHLEKVTFKRPQEPHPPYPYDTVNVSINVPETDVKLAATISTPKENEKYPAVVLVTGSGPQNRDEELYGHKPFKVIADYLTKKGIIVLRYDDRGVAQSTGNFAESNIADFSKDALAALSFLKKQPKVNPEKTGIIGHSEGGLIAFLLAGQRVDDLDFAVSLAGPAIPLDSLMVLQLYAVGKSEGMSEKQLEDVRPINRRNFSILKSELSDSEAGQALRQNMKDIMENDGGLIESEIKTLLLPSYRYFLKIDPIPFIQNINIPVFAAFGSKDIQVPHIENMESLTDNMPRNPKNVIKTYMDLNHLFQPAKTGRIVEYSEIETTIDEQVLNDIASWIQLL